jgi:hypothetical protein
MTLMPARGLCRRISLRSENSSDAARQQQGEGEKKSSRNTAKFRFHERDLDPTYGRIVAIESTRIKAMLLAPPVTLARLPLMAFCPPATKPPSCEQLWRGPITTL